MTSFRDRFAWRLLRTMGVYWKTIVIVVAPLALLPFIVVLGTSEAYCAFVLCLMASYWVTEVVPLAVTALLPFVLFPVLGILSAKAVAAKYIADASMTFVGGMMVALAVEKSGLHRRLALKVLNAVGAKPASIAVGFMIPTWFLSMWISNTAATSMMVTVVQSVIDRVKDGVDIKKRERAEQLAASNPCYVQETESDEATYFGSEPQPAAESTTKPPIFQNGAAHQNGGLHQNGNVHQNGEISQNGGLRSHSDPFTGNGGPSGTLGSGKQHEVVEVEPPPVEEGEDERQFKAFAKMLCLIVAYSSNIGGLATQTGTPTNILVSEQANKAYEEHGLKGPITYTTWIYYGLPNSVICLFIMWAWVQFFFLGWRSFCCCSSTSGGAASASELNLGDTIQKEYSELEKITFYEVSTMIALVLMVVLWIARDPGFAPGYAALFEDGYVSDAVPAMLVSFLLFVFPTTPPSWSWLRKDGAPAVSYPALLDWKTVSSKLPWGPVLILGGGYALAEGCDKSGLSEYLGEKLTVLESLPEWVMVLLIVAFVTFFTEFTSNAAVVSIVNPILYSMATALNINPLYVLLPSGMAATCAFMLPVATPPNAVVFAFGHLKVMDMVKVGFVLNVLCILVITMGIHTWGIAIFDVKHLPWSTVVENSTMSTTYF